VPEEIDWQLALIQKTLAKIEEILLRIDGKLTTLNESSESQISILEVVEDATQDTVVELKAQTKILKQIAVKLGVPIPPGPTVAIRITAGIPH